MTVGATACICVLRTDPINAVRSPPLVSLDTASTEPGLVLWLSSMRNSIWRPSTPPALLISSSAIFAPLI